jgi:hypothetical protein
LNGGRSSLFRVVATALAIPVIVFGLAAALGGLRLAAQPAIFNGKLVGDIATRLPVTLEPVLISFFLASALGFVLTLPSAPAFRVAVTALVVGLQSFPVFAFATGGVIFLSMLLGLQILICAAPCTFGGQVALLVLPVVVLTMYQLPILVEFFYRRRTRGLDARADEISTVRGLALLFGDRLPSLISAAMIGELLYRWRGEGWWLDTPHHFFDDWPASVFTLFLIFNALVVLAIRCIIELLVQRRKSAMDVDG